MPPYGLLTEELLDRDIRPSLQRVMILDLLRTERNHPTADQIYVALRGSVRSVSKATVYNNLALFAQKGLLSVLTFADSEHRYDATVEPHGHFVCEQCGTVTDFPVRPGLLEADLPEGALVRHMEVLLTGLCEKCLL